MEFARFLVFMFLLFFIGVIVCGGYRQVYICVCCIYIIILYFFLCFFPCYIWLLCNKIIFLMLFYCFIVCFTRLSYVFVWWSTYFFDEKSDFSYLGFFFVLGGSRLFLCFWFLQSCAVFIQTSAFFLQSSTFFIQRSAIFWQSSTKLFIRVCTNCFIVYQTYGFLASFLIWRFLWAWNLYTFGVDTIVRWYTNTGSVGFFFIIFTLAIVPFQL